MSVRYIPFQSVKNIGDKGGNNIFDDDEASNDHLTKHALAQLLQPLVASQTAMSAQLEQLEITIKVQQQQMVQVAGASQMAAAQIVRARDANKEHANALAAADASRQRAASTAITSPLSPLSAASGSGSAAGGSGSGQVSVAPAPPPLKETRRGSVELHLSRANEMSGKVESALANATALTAEAYALANFNERAEGCCAASPATRGDVFSRLREMSAGAASPRISRLP